MKKTQSFAFKLLPVFLTAWLLAPPVHAATIWNGPNITFTHSVAAGSLQDAIVAGVSITRSSGGGGLYNSATEGGATSGTSPKDTTWAVGSLANYSTLSYTACPLEAGHHPPGLVGTTFVVHLVAEDIYFSLTLTGWGGAGGAGEKTFSYTRSTAPAPTPTVSLTNPVSNAILSAPASVLLGASASVSSGTITNVQFLTNGVSCGSVAAAPFNLTANNLPAGTYAIKAVATAAGISATSPVVNITVITPPVISLTNPVNGAVFAAPASLRLGANATLSSGTVTNVQFLTNGVGAGTSLTAPFSFTANNLAAGAYALKAVATGSGISTTSAVVNVSIVNPTAISLSAPQAQTGQFTFSYSANTGLSYVIQSSTNLQTWVPLTTNVAPANSVLFTNPATSGNKFYRVGRMPNP